LYTEHEMPMEQAGFRIGCRTSNQTTNVRWITERARDHQKSVAVFHRLLKGFW